jgi:hypothetical protein
MLTPQRPLLTEWRRITGRPRRSPDQISLFAARLLTHGHLKNRAGRKHAFQAPFWFYGNDGTKFPKNCRGRLGAVSSIAWLGGVFGNARLHKLLHESGGKRFVCWKSNRAFSEIVSGKLFLVRPDGVSTGIEGAMVLRSAERDQQPRSEAVAWNVVADALFGGGRRGFDVSTKLLKRGSLRGAHACKVVINRFRLGRHDFFCVRIAAESQVIFFA